MNDKFNPKIMKDDESKLDIADEDYKNLIDRLQDISSTIALLEKKIFR